MVQASPIFIISLLLLFPRRRRHPVDEIHERGSFLAEKGCFVVNIDMDTIPSIRSKENFNFRRRVIRGQDRTDASISRPPEAPPRLLVRSQAGAMASDGTCLTWPGFARSKHLWPRKEHQILRVISTILLRTGLQGRNAVSTSACEAEVVQAQAQRV